MTDNPITSTAFIPIACLLPADGQQRRSGELHDLFAQATISDELPAGYTFHFPLTPEIGKRLLDFMMMERACCPFFHFALRSIPPHDGLWLDLSGAEGVKEIIAATFIATFD